MFASMMQKYIALSNEFRNSNQSKESIEKLYEFLDEIVPKTDNTSYLIQSYVYTLLGYHQKAYHLFAPLANKSNRKDISRLYEMEQLAKSHGDTFALKRKQQPIDKDLYYPKIEHFIETKSSKYFTNFEYKMPVVIFGKVFSKPLLVCVDKKIKVTNFWESVVEYILFLGDCKQKLIRYYNKNMEDEASDEWYESLEIFSVTIDISAKGKLCARITCGDELWEDHLLDIEFEKEKITDMTYDG